MIWSITSWIRYYIDSKTIYQVHSPLVYHVLLIISSNISKLSIQDDIDIRKVSLSDIASPSSRDNLKNLGYTDSKLNLTLYHGLRKNQSVYTKWQNQTSNHNDCSASIDYGRFGIMIESPLLIRNYNITLIDSSLKPWLKLGL